MQRGGAVAWRRVAVAFSATACAALLLAGLPAHVAPAPGGTEPVAARGTRARHGRSCTTARAVAAWPLRRRAAQLVAIPVAETHLGVAAPAVAAGIGGIVLFGSDGPGDLGSMLQAIARRAPGGVAPFVMTDEEGGGVQRLANLVGWVPWARSMARRYSPGRVAHLARGLGRRLRAAGVSMDLAPDLDLASGPGPDARRTDGPRSFSPEPARATSYGLAFARGLLASGVVPVVKHFPGEGRASANSDDAPAITPPLARLRRSGLLPFAAAARAHLPAAMVGDDTVPGLTRLPAALSPSAYRYLRHTLGFSGLVLTDSLSAIAVSAAGYPVPAAAVRAVESGADMVLFTARRPRPTARAVVSALVGAVRAGTLAMRRLDGAVLAVLVAKHARLCGAPTPYPVG